MAKLSSREYAHQVENIVYDLLAIRNCLRLMPERSMDTKELKRLTNTRTQLAKSTKITGLVENLTKIHLGE
jgi:hypothetical protein